jgi:hypothetical protein
MSSDEEKHQNPQEPPNGGARAWGVALGAFAAQMYISPNYTIKPTPHATHHPDSISQADKCQTAPPDHTYP